MSLAATAIDQASSTANYLTFASVLFVSSQLQLPFCTQINLVLAAAHTACTLCLVCLQPKSPGLVVETLVQYLQTDSACCREEEGGQVAERQDEVFQPLPLPLGGFIGLCVA